MYKCEKIKPQSVISSAGISLTGASLLPARHLCRADRLLGDSDDSVSQRLWDWLCHRSLQGPSRGPWGCRRPYIDHPSVGIAEAAVSPAVARGRDLEHLQNCSSEWKVPLVSSSVEMLQLTLVRNKPVFCTHYSFTTDSNCSEELTQFPNPCPLPGMGRESEKGNTHGLRSEKYNN